MFRFLQKKKQQQANWQKAEIHSRATLVGKPINNTGDPNQFCQCCGLTIQKQQMPLCQNTKELQFLGVGFPLYFIFLKYCIIFMFLESACTGIAGLSYAIQNNYDFCIKRISKVVPNLNKKVECASYYVYLANIGDYLPRQVIILRVVGLLITIAFFIYMRDSLSKLIGYYDERNTTFSDYSVIMKYVPNKENIKESLKKVLQNYDIYSMTILGPFQHIEKLKLQLQHTCQQRKKVLSIIQSNPNNIKQLHNGLDQLEILQTNIEKLQRSLLKTLIQEQKKYQNDQITPQTIIISFNTNENRQELLQSIQKQSQSVIPEGWSFQEFKKMEVAQSPEPRDIIWANLSVSQKTKYRNRVIGWSITCVILIVISIIFYFALKEVTTLIEHQSEAHHETFAYTAFYLLQILIIFINKFLLSPVLHKISHSEYYLTKTSEEYSYSLKYLLSMFFTSALMTVFVEGLTHKNYYVHKFGVIDSESVMIILNSFMIPLIWLINPWTLVKRAKQCYYRSRNKLSQAEANEVMEQLPYTMGKRYAEIVKIVWLVSMYESLIPWGYVCATLGLGLYYWIDKYNLLRRSSIKQQISGKITLQIMSLLELALIIECFGQLFFDLQIRYQYSITSIIFAIIAVIYVLAPKQTIIQCIHGEKFQSEQKRLDECVEKLGASYQDLHPILGKKLHNLIASLNEKYEEVDRLYQSKRQYYSIKKISQFSKIKENQNQSPLLKKLKNEFMTENSNKQALLQKQMVVMDDKNIKQCIPE